MARSQRRRRTPAAGEAGRRHQVARDAMRKDAGLNGDLDRIPQLAWLLFLKAFDGLEQNREVTEPDFRPAIEAPYRWRDWAADPNGRTGEALLDFVNGELLPVPPGARPAPRARSARRARRRLQGDEQPDALRLPPARRRQQGQRDQLRVVRRHPHDGAPLRVDAARDARRGRRLRRVLHTAAGHPVHRPAGRPAARRDRPRPACGTGGFLVEALEHLLAEGQDRAAAPTMHNEPARHREEAAAVPARDDEPRPPRVGQPNIVRGNALARPITQISKRDRVDVDPHQPAVRRRGGEDDPGELSRRTSRPPRRRGCSCSS